MTNDKLPTRLMLVISAIQGIALWALYRAFESDSWPSESPVWSFPLWTLATALPVLFLLSLEKGNESRLTQLLGLFAVVLTVAATYVGYQALPFGEFPVSSLGWIYAFGMSIVCFKALMYLQQYAARAPLSYPTLFSNSWRNFLVLALASLFVLIFWLILVLWGQLFKVIGIQFFHELFEEDWFLIPVLAVALGVGIALFRNLIHIIDGITNLLRGLIKFLLPLVISVAGLFLFALPFTGLEVLWSTGHGTALLLWLIAAILFFVNAVYQDGRGEEPYNLFWHRLIYVGLLALPALAGLSLYGLLLRVGQHGLSVSRCWAFVVWLLLTLFALGYVVGVARMRDRWSKALASVNTAMGLVVLFVILLANSPILDFRKLSVSSQLARVRDGDIAMTEFDFWYARSRLARPGYLAVEEIKATYGADDPDLLAQIERSERHFAASSVRSADKFWSNVSYRPQRFEVPSSLAEIIDTQVRFGSVQDVFFEVDLDADGEAEYVLLTRESDHLQSAIFYYLEDDQWQVRYLTWQTEEGDQSLEETLLRGELSLAEPRFKNLRVGKLIFQTR